jgi:hypothetical protein
MEDEEKVGYELKNIIHHINGNQFVNTNKNLVEISVS